MPLELEPTLISQKSTYRSTPTDTSSEGESLLKTKSSMLPEWPYNLKKGVRVAGFVLEGFESVK